MRSAPLAVEPQDRSVIRAVAARRQCAGASPHPDEDKRQSNSKHCGQDRCQANARIGNRDRHNGGNHPQPANTLDLDLGHVDHRG
jgi:hypothetical protein